MEIGKISEFNEAVLQIQRLNDIWRSCRTNRKNGNLAAVRWDLNDAWIELAFDAKRLDKEKKRTYCEQIKTINGDINSIAKTINKTKMYHKLIEKEILLREIQQEAGKGGKYKREDEDDIL